MNAWLVRHLLGGYARAHPLRPLVAIGVIAIGVALGYAIQLINASALAEFASALRQTHGGADAAIAGSREGFAEDLYARAAADRDVQWASPLLAVDVAIVAPERLRGRSLSITGIDALRAGLLTPELIGVGAEATSENGDPWHTLEDGVFLSPDALRVLQLAPGDTLTAQIGSRTQTLRVAGRLPTAHSGQIAGTMDLGFAQWRLDQLGRLTRIDLKLAPGADRAALAARLRLPPGVAVLSVSDELERGSNISLAYRVNLDVLALVALFTGSFLVFSLQSQSVLARRAQFEFLRVLGAGGRDVERLLIVEGLLLGAIGSALGVALGIGVATAALHLLGGDLGGGFFSARPPPLVVTPWIALVFFALGVGAAVAGSWRPARRAARFASGATANGTERTAYFRIDARTWNSLATSAMAMAGVIAVAGVMLMLPPIKGIPVAAYAAIALLLLAAIAAQPQFATRAFAALARALDPPPSISKPPPFAANADHPSQTHGANATGAADTIEANAIESHEIAENANEANTGGTNKNAAATSTRAGDFHAIRWLALARMAGSPSAARDRSAIQTADGANDRANDLAAGAAGIVASFALMVAMATMVASFRHSLEVWLERVLPADLYVRAAATTAGGATSASFSAAEQQRMRDAPGVARATFNRTVRVSLDPARAPVVLIARGLERADAASVLPLTGAALTWRAGMPPPCWVSEAIVDLYGARLGQEIALPIAEQAQRFVVAGVWRDYARQTGAIVIEAGVYQQLTGDNTRTEGALWLQPGAHSADVTRELSSQLATRSAEFSDASTIRALSLRIFDRSFAVTYALELAAIGIGLVGIAATFSAQAIARQREFGMLRHLGATRSQILAMLALEAVLLTLAAIAVGWLVGLAIAWILVAIVNPQSFHWTMDLTLPLGTLASLTIALLACAAITARIAGRSAVAADAVLAVRADW